MNRKTIQTSKFLSFVLRHQPESIGLTLDANGWAEVEQLLHCANANGRRIDRELLELVVATSDKQRFAFSDDGQRIRANQGHSKPVDLGLEQQTPPEFLYHGTVTRFLASIRDQGLVRGTRHHVHLSADMETAERVGGRRGRPVVLLIQAADLHQTGAPFYRSENGVWLTEHVPASFIEFPVDEASD